MRQLLCLTGFFFITGCGGSAPAPQSPLPQTPPRAEAGPEVEGLLGSIDEGEVQSVFDRHREQLLSCYSSQLDDLEELGGEIEISVRLDRSGSPQSVFLSRSSLGSAAAESCMVRQVAAFDFPTPSGGPAELSYPLELSSGVRSPSSLETSSLSAVTLEHQQEIETCLRGVSDATVTLYVDAGGRVLSGGGSGGSALAFEAAQCIARAASAWTLPAPGVTIAKGELRF